MPARTEDTLTMIGQLVDQAEANDSIRSGLPRERPRYPPLPRRVLAHHLVRAALHLLRRRRWPCSLRPAIPAGPAVAARATVVR